MNDLSKCAIAAVCLLVQPAVGSAANLRVIGSNDHMEVSVDVDTIKVVEGSHTEVIVYTRYSEPQENPGITKFNATLARVLIRCGNVTGTISTLAFFDDDKLIKKFDYELMWRSVDPHTDIGQVWKYICTRQWENER
jgi:hypothetical protein